MFNADLSKLLKHKKRKEIFDLIHKKYPRTALELSEELKMRKVTVLSHLKLLVASSWIRRERPKGVAQTYFYYPSSEPILVSMGRLGNIKPTEKEVRAYEKIFLDKQYKKEFVKPFIDENNPLSLITFISVLTSDEGIKKLKNWIDSREDLKESWKIYITFWRKIENAINKKLKSTTT